MINCLKMSVLLVLGGALVFSCEKEQKNPPQDVSKPETSKAQDTLGQATAEETEAFRRQVQGKLAELDKNLAALNEKIGSLKKKRADLGSKLTEIQKKKEEAAKDLAVLTNDKKKQKALQILLDELLALYKSLNELVT